MYIGRPRTRRARSRPRRWPRRAAACWPVGLCVLRLAEQDAYILEVCYIYISIPIYLSIYVYLPHRQPAPPLVPRSRRVLARWSLCSAPRIYTCMYVYLYVYICVYIYIERESFRVPAAPAAGPAAGPADPPRAGPLVSAFCASRSRMPLNRSTWVKAAKGSAYSVARWATRERTW